MSAVSDGPDDLPPLLAPDAAADASHRFRVLRDRAALWFEPGDRALIVTFDNLATIDHPYPRSPWLKNLVQDLGFALLGVQSFAKDWYRNPDAVPLVRQLEADGFFARFDRVVFIGASMGAFAAINMATLVPGVSVIALSPQSTMSRKIAPFEGRFGWAVKRSDWTTPHFLDAAETVRRLDRVVVLFDGRVNEDRLHAARLAGPNVQMLRIDHTTHEAVRVVLKCGALGHLIAGVAERGQPGPEFWQAMRNRRTVRKWARAFFEQVTAEGHPARIRAAGAALLRQDDYLFVHRGLKRLANSGID
ncbi:S9 family peptidase [Tabrizicola sp. YIM 78059]|uniref:alpha/beta hydrolase family protein n=1 Tax=Tabrizicola sp. YIM 78059 TaxID=2529861 RepID=UPI0010AAC49F|nr:hypothetical protein [Tabrizicola sp. YIM 78059]